LFIFRNTIHYSLMQVLQPVAVLSRDKKWLYFNVFSSPWKFHVKISEQISFRDYFPLSFIGNVKQWRYFYLLCYE